MLAPNIKVCGITRYAITNAGILWKDGKNIDKSEVLIYWTPVLNDTIMRGQRYTKGGWKAILNDLMQDCVTESKNCL